MGNHMAMIVLALRVMTARVEIVLPFSIVSVFFAVRFEQHLVLILQRRILPLPLGFEKQGERITTGLPLAPSIDQGVVLGVSYPI